MDKSDAIARTLDAMWARFLPDIRERVSVLDSAAAALSNGAFTEDLRAAAQSAGHKLAGTLGTFGLQRGTDLAREIEERLLRGELRADQSEWLKQSAQEIRAIIESRSPSVNLG